MTDKAFFNLKPTKRSNPEARTTLDNLHQIHVGGLKKNKAEVIQLKEQIAQLEKESSQIQDIVLKSQKETLLDRLKERLNKIDSNKEIFDYFFDTGELLYKYYDLQDKIQSGEGVKGGSGGKKAKAGSVLAALQEASVEESQPVKDTFKEGKTELLDKYLQKIDPAHAKANPAPFEDQYGICEVCDKEMTFSANEALFNCETCGHQEFILIDSDKPSYKDPPREVTYYAYKRINHFNELLAQFQAKESTEIPEEVFQAILDELKKERITNTEVLTRNKIRDILKKLHLTNFYEHVPYILNRLNGKTSPLMPRDVEEKLRFMFKEIQGSFHKHCPAERSNFLSYSYVLYKFCELLELDEYLHCFPLLKNRDKLFNQDKIWALICADMGWQFIRSI
jgi:hypothetical protein